MEAKVSRRSGGGGKKGLEKVRKRKEHTIVCRATAICCVHAIGELSMEASRDGAISNTVLSPSKDVLRAQSARLRFRRPGRATLQVVVLVELALLGIRCFSLPRPPTMQILLFAASFVISLSIPCAG